LLISVDCRLLMVIDGLLIHAVMLFNLQSEINNQHCQISLE